MKIKFEFLKSRIATLVSHYDWYALYSLRNKGYLFNVGWFESYRQKSAVDKSGSPVPWITYPSLNFLDGRVRKDFTVFEYGSGNSTFWWAQRSDKIISCEHDPIWYANLLKTIPANVDLRHIPLDYGGAYSRLISEFPRQFDVVFVDGRDRVNCVQNALGALKPSGVIILDNSDDESYRPALNFMLENGFRRLDFVGPGPITTTVWRTSIFYRRNNCLEI